MTPLERVYTILEQLLLNGPMSFRELRSEIQAPGFILAGDLVTLAKLGAVKIDPPLFQPCEDPPPPTQIEAGLRLRLAVLAARVRE